jgi:hypothetical protein
MKIRFEWSVGPGNVLAKDAKVTISDDASVYLNDSKKVVGRILSAKVVAAGIEFEAEITDKEMQERIRERMRNGLGLMP